MIISPPSMKMQPIPSAIAMRQYICWDIPESFALTYWAPINETTASRLLSLMEQIRAFPMRYNGGNRQTNHERFKRRPEACSQHRSGLWRGRYTQFSFELQKESLHIDRRQ
jgi:hypothetical protein